jgi:hypothetical protein
MAVAQLKAMLGLDSGAYRTGARDVMRQNDSLKRSFGDIGRAIGVSFSIAGIVMAGRTLMKWASGVSLAARNTGLLTSEMIALEKVAAQTGLGVNEMQRLVSRMQTELYNAAKGSDEAKQKFERMGLSIDNLIKQDPAEMLQNVARAAMETGIPLETLADLFGERLGPQAVEALRRIAQNGLPEVDEAIGRTADKLEMLGSRWAKTFKEIKAWTLGLVADIGELHAKMTDFIGGVFARGEDGKMMGIEGGRQLMTRGIEQRETEVDKIEEKRLMEREEKKTALAAVLDESRAKKRAEIEAKYEQQIARERERGESIAARVKGVGVDQGSMAKIGGMFGGGRPELAAMDRVAKLQAEQVEINKRIEDLLRERNDMLSEMTTTRGAD